MPIEGFWGLTAQDSPFTTVLARTAKVHCQERRPTLLAKHRHQPGNLELFTARVDETRRGRGRTWHCSEISEDEARMVSTDAAGEAPKAKEPLRLGHWTSSSVRID